MVAVLKLVAIVLVLVDYLGVWGFLGLVAGIVAVFWAVSANSDRLLSWFIHSQTLAIGKVMEGATMTIRTVTRTGEPDPSVWRTGDDEEDDAFEEDLKASGMPDGDYDWFTIDAEVAPRPDPNGGEPVTWDPGMIQMSRNTGKTPHALEFDMHCLIAQVKIWREGRFDAHQDGETVTGTARIELHVGVTPGTSDVQFRYLGIAIGQGRLPSYSRSLSR